MEVMKQEVTNMVNQMNTEQDKRVLEVIYGLLNKHKEKEGS